jgi:5-methylcytosine-specific restriction endonuclease McrA
MRAQYVRDHRGEGCARASEDCTQDLTVDHVVPSSRGGAEDPRNFQLLCGRHNSSKGAR